MNLLLFCTLLSQLSTPEHTKARYQTLPDWGQKAVMLANHPQFKKPSDEKGLWRIYEESKIILRDNGKLITLRRQALLVLSYKGVEAASTFVLHGSEGANTIEHIKGWHLEKAGYYEELNKNDAVTMGSSKVNAINTSTYTMLQFNRVAPESLILVESIEVEKSFLGSVTRVSVLSKEPTRELNIEIEDKRTRDEPLINMEIIPVGLKAWELTPQIQHNKLSIRHIPGIGNQAQMAPYNASFPYVLVRFMPKDNSQNRYASWNNYARWYHNVFKDASLAEAPSFSPGTASLKAVQALAIPFREQITYRQVYLSEARGFVPIAGNEVMRRKYGDCKDMVSCLTHLGHTNGLKVLPALASIVDGAYITEAYVPDSIFNHVIGAIKLEKTLGLPSEVITKSGERFLLYDPTDKVTPIGFMNSGYLHRKVMICTSKGAQWVAVPNQAIAKPSLNFKLEGDLDKDFNFNGTLEVHEKNNAYWFLKTYATKHEKHLENTLKLVLGLPPLSEVSLISTERRSDKDEHLIFKLNIQWPAFMRKDADGYRLSNIIVTDPPGRLTQPGKPRLSPIKFESVPKTTWQLDLKTALPLVPASVNESYQDPYFQYQWEAQSEQRLHLNFTYQHELAFFPINQVNKGVNAWRKFAREYDKFRHLGTIFYLKEP